VEIYVEKFERVFMFLNLKAFGAALVNIVIFGYLD
jgi:hypothetical protein